MGKKTKTNPPKQVTCDTPVVTYTTVYVTPVWGGGFPSSIARQPRGCQY